MITILSFVFVLGVLVFVHELGHFLAAKRVGIRVLRFQLGFNPTIASVKYGDTEYSIGALPLGGYVKMAGESVEEGRTGGTDEFLSKTKWQRFQVLVMGPVMNLLLAVLLTAVVLYQGAQVPSFEDQPPVVGAVAMGSPAESADITVGDRILSVADHDVATWQDFYVAVGTRPNREVDIALLRNGTALTRRVTPVPPPGRSRFEIGDIGVFPDVHPRLLSISAGMPGEKAGLKGGDVVLAINGQTMTFSSQLRDVISKHPNEAITMRVLREGRTLDIPVTPALNGTIGRIGVGIGDETKSINPGGFQAMQMAVEQNIKNSVLIFQTVWGLVTGDTSPRQLMGPVAIAQLSGESAQLGWIALFSLMASISLNLGLLNLFPIPILDGGHILIMALEGVSRRDFSLKVKEKMLLAGFVVLIMLMVTVIYNDLTRIAWVERLMPWRWPLP